MVIKTERKPSEIIEDFLTLCEKSHEEFSGSKSRVDYFNAKTYDNVHDLEDCTDEQLIEFAKSWRQETWERRAERDNMALWEGLHKFTSSDNNKPFLKRLRGLLVEQKRTEEYLRVPPHEREFKKGVDGKRESG